MISQLIVSQQPHTARISYLQLERFEDMDNLQQTAFFLQGPTSLSAQIHSIGMAPLDPILGTMIAFQKDQDSNKMNLGVGAYRDEDGKPYVFKVVQRIQSNMHNKVINHEYLEIDGNLDFVRGARNLIFGADNEAVKSNRIASTQTISGTGAVSLGLQFVAKYLPRQVHVSKPTWGNHNSITQKIGLPLKEYTYYDSKTRSLDFKGMIQSLKNATPGSVILLHACAHNPTGVDPTVEQWKQICEVMKANNLIPFFDSAYQGFASGSLEKDIWPVRYFLQQGFNMLVAQSFAKNMGLYGERVGALHIVVSNQDLADRVLSQIKIIIRQIYSSPSRYGAEVASQILNNKANFQEWEKELRDIVSKRITDMRALLRSNLEQLQTPGTWNHITDQIGMFSYTGLSEKVCEILINKYHIYLLKSGRISVAGVNTKNVKYLAQSIKAAILEAGEK